MTVLLVDVSTVAFFCPGFKILPQAYIRLESDQDLKRDKVQRLCRSFIMKSALNATFKKVVKLQIYMITKIDLIFIRVEPIKKAATFLRTMRILSYSIYCLKTELSSQLPSNWGVYPKWILG